MRGGSTHSVSFVDTAAGTPEIGFMLARDKRGVPLYSEGSMSPFSALQAAGYVDEASQDPRMMYPLAFSSSWVGGFGAGFLHSGEPRRYLASYGVDASEDGILKLGPKWTAINWPSYSPTTGLTNGDFETWNSATDAASWTETGTVNRDATNFRSGIYGASITAGAQEKESIAWDNAYRGKTIYVSVFYYEEGTGYGTISIYDGVGTTTSSQGTGGWGILTVSRTLDANATECTIKLDATTDVVVFDDCAVAILGATTSYVDWNGLQYMASGNALFKANSATAPTAWTFVCAFPYNITSLFADSNLVVMTGSGNTVAQRGWQINTSGVPTQMADGGGTDSCGDYMTRAGATYYLSGRATGETTGSKYVIRTSTSLTGAWSSDTKVGTALTNITGLKTVNNVVYIAKEDGLWKVNTDGTVSMLIDYTDKYATTSGVGIFGWNNKVYVPVGVNSLIEYDPDSGTWADISPAATVSGTTQAAIATADAVLSSIQGDFDGRIMAVAGGATGNELWIIQDNGSVNNLFKGVYANIDTTGWHWHPVANTTMGDVTAMSLSALTGAPIIWVGHGTGNPGYYNLAQYEITDPTYTTPCLFTPYYSGGVWRMMKALYSIILGLESITAAVYVTLQYRFYGTSSWSSPALTFDGAAGTVSNGQDQNYMPANSFGTAIQFRLNLVSNSATATPKVTRLAGEGKVKPSEVPVFDFTVVLADKQRGKNGVRDAMLASRKATCLDNVRNSNWPVSFYDIDGTLNTVDVLDRKLISWRKEAGRNPEMVYRVLVHKVTLS